VAGAGLAGLLVAGVDVLALWEGLMPKPAPTETAIIRYIGGQVDDASITCDTFRLEQMTRDSWWAAACRGDRTTMFWLRWDKGRKEIVATVTQDDIGCTEVRR
jgi:hypothetical protein